MNTVAGTIFTSIKSATEKETCADDNMTEVNQDLNVTQWKTFNEASNKKILDNYKRIGEVMLKINEPHNTFDALYRTRIEKLEVKNTELKVRLDSYNGNETQQETFKNDFIRDVDEVGNNIKNLFK